VLAYRRIGPDVELVIEQTVVERTCPTCGVPGQIKERPTVRYVDLPVYGQPMRLAWRKHRLICRRPDCAGASWTSADHRIAAKNCLLTTRCAKWATLQVGTGRAVSDVAGELSCDWHTVNDAVMTYGAALLAADRRRLNATTAIGLDETSFVKLAGRRGRSYATTVADVANHQIIEILPTRSYVPAVGVGLPLSAVCGEGRPAGRHRGRADAAPRQRPRGRAVRARGGGRVDRRRRLPDPLLTGRASVPCA